MNNESRFQELINEVLILFDESLEFHRDSQKDEQILDAFQYVIKTLGSISKRLDHEKKSSYTVAVVGLGNVGKSTLLNALLGKEYTPRRNGPCTVAPIEFKYHDKLSVCIHERGNLRRNTEYCSTVEDVHQCLSLLTDGNMASDTRKIERVIVNAPIPILEKRLIIADTPGFGAIHQTTALTEDVLKNYLIRISQVFLVVLAEQGISKSECEFFSQGEHFADICDDIIVTGSDEYDQNDKNRFKQRYTQKFHNRPQFHFVSGLLGVKARKEGDDSLLMEAGIPEIEKRIRDISDKRKRVDILYSTFLESIKDFGVWLSDYQQNVGHIRTLWRLDSLHRWRYYLSQNTGQLSPEIVLLFSEK